MPAVTSGSVLRLRLDGDDTPVIVRVPPRVYKGDVITGKVSGGCLHITKVEMAGCEGSGVHKPCPLGQVLLVYELPDVVGLEILDLGDNRLIPVVREFRSNCFLVTLRSWNVLYALEAFDEHCSLEQVCLGVVLVRVLAQGVHLLPVVGS